MFFRYSIGFSSIFYLTVQFVTTTLHVYQECLKNSILPDSKPEPGLKIPGYVQLLLLEGRSPDDINIKTLVISAHQLSEHFYKTTVLYGSEIHQLMSDLSNTRQVIQLDGLHVDKLARRARQQFRKLHENIVFFEREILAFTIQYERSYECMYGTGVEIKRKCKIHDAFLRQMRQVARDLNRKANILRDQASQSDSAASSITMMLMFLIAYFVIGLVSPYAIGTLKICLLCGITCLAVCGSFYATEYSARAKDNRVRASRAEAEHLDILKEIREYQDLYVFPSRNGTISDFIKLAEEKHVIQTIIVLNIFTELTNRLQWIDMRLHELSILSESLEKKREMYEKMDMLEDKSGSIIQELRETVGNTTSDIDSIYRILK